MNEHAIDTDDEEVIHVCSYRFNAVNLSMFGLVDDFCSIACQDAWRSWWERANSVQSS